VNTDVPDQLRLLALVDRYGSLSGAADAWGLTAAAVTQRLARAERDWGTALVRRGPRGAWLTPAGAVLAPYGERVDQQVRAATDAFDAFRGQASHRLRIGAFMAAALHLLPPALTALRHRHPDVDLTVVDLLSANAVQAVAAGDLDVAVLATWDSPAATLPGVAVRHLLRDPLVVVLPDDHRLARPGGGALRLRQLAHENWVVIRAGMAPRDQFNRAAAQAGFEPQLRFETESYDVAQALVGTGVAVALVSRLALTRASGTTWRPLVGPALHRDLHVAVAADTSLTPLVDTYVGLLTDVARDLKDGWA